LKAAYQVVHLAEKKAAQLVAVKAARTVLSLVETKVELMVVQKE